MSEALFNAASAVPLGSTAASSKTKAFAAIDRYWTDNGVIPQAQEKVFNVFLAQFSKQPGEKSPTRSMSLGNIVADIAKTSKNPEQLKYTALRAALDTKGKERKKGDNRKRVSEEKEICLALLGDSDIGRHIVHGVAALFVRVNHVMGKPVTYQYGSIKKVSEAKEDTCAWKLLVPECLSSGKVKSLVGCGSNGLYFTSDLSVYTLAEAISSVFPVDVQKFVRRLPAKELIAIYMIQVDQEVRKALYIELEKASAAYFRTT